MLAAVPVNREIERNRLATSNSALVQSKRLRAEPGEDPRQSTLLRELNDATQWLEDMLERLPVAIYSVDRDGLLTMARGSILPEGMQQGIGRPFAEAVARFPEILVAVDEAMAGRDQAFSSSADGRHFELLVNPMRDGTTVRGVLGMVIEVTEQRRMAEARTESQEKSRFLANVSHELRTPLNSILGFSDLLLMPLTGALNDRQHRYVANIQSSGNHLLQLMNELLDVTNVHAGRLPVAIGAVDPAVAVNETIERMAPIAESLGVGLLAGPQSHRPVAADPMRLSQILINLVTNALKFTQPPGDVKVRSFVSAGSMVFAVTDTGIGIAAEHQERVFEEFFQVPSKSTAAKGGSGLGLALSRGLARAMDGDLTLHSRPGRGSTFQLRLPLYEALA
jgi:signal transduction histidine kinase